MAPPDRSLPASDVAVTRWWKSRPRIDKTVSLIDEEPLSIRVQGRPYVVVMRTPGAEKAHAAGLCLAEGIVDALDDIADIAVCDGRDTNVVTVTLTPGARERLAPQPDRREWISQTGCGLCGKRLVEDLFQEIAPVTVPTVLPADMTRACLDDLPNHQPLRRASRAAHAAAIYNREGRLMTVAEDVGRHNALDKVVGSLFLDNQLASAALLVLSSRISYELVQKAARARIPVIAAVSRPTALAVSLAGALNICLAVGHPDGGLAIYTHPHRLT